MGEGCISLLIPDVHECLILTLDGGYKLIDTCLENHDRLCFDLDLQVALFHEEDYDILHQAKLLA